MIRETTQFLHNELERNFACAMAGQAESRRANIDEMHHPLQRLGERALLSFAEHLPGTTAHLLQRDIAAIGYSYLGAGSEHTAIKDGEEVIKIHRKSVYFNEYGRLQLAEQFNEQHTLLRDYLGSMAVAQTTISNIHPLNFERRAVQSTQNFVEFEDTELFPAYDSGLNAEALRRLKSRYPGIETALQDFAVSGLNLFEKEKLLVDTSGLHNVVVTKGSTPELKCLDGTPAYINQSSVVERITGQLLALKLATKTDALEPTAVPANAQ